LGVSRAVRSDVVPIPVRSGGFILTLIGAKEIGMRKLTSGELAQVYGGGGGGKRGYGDGHGKGGSSGGHGKGGSSGGYGKGGSS
jgi:hypothetical protein